MRVWEWVCLALLLRQPCNVAAQRLGSPLQNLMRAAGSGRALPAYCYMPLDIGGINGR
jgi:hypothetical protein